MANVEKAIKGKRAGGLALVTVGLVFAFLLILLDLFMADVIDLGWIQMYLILFCFILVLGGSIYLSASSLTLVKQISIELENQKAQITLLKKKVDMTKETIEGITEMRLDGLSETITRAELAEIASRPKPKPLPRVVEEKPDKDEVPSVPIPKAPAINLPKADPVPGLGGGVEKETGEVPKPPVPKPSPKWETKKEERPMPPPPPKIPAPKPLKPPPTIPPKPVPVPTPEPTPAPTPEPEEPHKADSPLGSILSYGAGMKEEEIPIKKEPEKDEEDEDLDEHLTRELDEMKSEDEEELETPDEEKAEEKTADAESAIPPIPPLAETPEKPAEETGAPPEEKTEDDINCPNCGKKMKPHWRNCPYCRVNLK
jgi:hypothetical protein